MVRKRTKKKKEIDWNKILPPMTKIPGKTRLAEEQDIKELSRRMRENPPLPKPFKEKI